jgi:hypothetical protein
MMSRLLWVAAVLAPVVVAVLGLRWAFADFLLDEFGSLADACERNKPVPRQSQVASVGRGSGPVTVSAARGT